MTNFRQTALFLFALPALMALGMAGEARADVVCDLRTLSSCSINGGLFYVDEQHPTGTGVIDSFLRIQQKGFEQGYNTSTRPIEHGMDSKTDPNYTRDLLLSEVGTKTIDGVLYREFFLDVNEPAAETGDRRDITLDQLEIFLSDTAGLSNYEPENPHSPGGNNDGGTLEGATKIYDMDTAIQDGFVQINYLVTGEGSGSSDMVFYLPDSLFGDFDYVYLFSQFGDFQNRADKYESQAGFEEWFVKESVPPPDLQIPEPGTLLLLGSGLALAARRRLHLRRPNAS